MTWNPPHIGERIHCENHTGRVHAIYSDGRLFLGETGVEEECNGHLTHPCPAWEATSNRSSPAGEPT